MSSVVQAARFRLSSSSAESAALTERFYQAHAREYFQRTVSADMTHLYERVLPRLRAGARILDAGAGSGRDLKAFVARGYQAIGIDSSPALVEMAKAYSGAPCVVGHLEELPYERCFEAIWACASILHVPKAVLPIVLGRIRDALIPGGLLYVSVQEGNGERIVEDGRFFAFYRYDEFVQAIVGAGFRVDDAWCTHDVLPQRESIEWINVVATVESEKRV